MVKVSVHAFALSVKQAIEPMASDTSQGEPWLDAASRLPVYFCIRLGEHFLCAPLPLPLPTPKAEQSSVSTVSFILLRALLYTTPTPLTFHNPLTLNPHLYLFIDHPTRLFCHANPCIGTCLIALHCRCSGRTRRDIPNVFGMSSTYARVVLCIPARLYYLTPCHLVVLSVSPVPSPPVTIVANRIGLTLSAKFCRYGFFS